MVVNRDQAGLRIRVEGLAFCAEINLVTITLSTSALPAEFGTVVKLVGATGDKSSIPRVDAIYAHFIDFTHTDSTGFFCFFSFKNQLIARFSTNPQRLLLTTKEIFKVTNRL